jgi:hypothetical protein
MLIPGTQYLIMKGARMAEGGFLVKFDGKEVTRCFAVSFDYDERQYTINDTEKKELPQVNKITIEVE